jgi:hypothetical protein
MYQAINKGISIRFPKGSRNAPRKLYEVVKYFSAYHVRSYGHIDYPKHVESLILRLSKPPLNENIGTLGSLLDDVEGAD